MAELATLGPKTKTENPETGTEKDAGLIESVSPESATDTATFTAEQQSEIERRVNSAVLTANEKARAEKKAALDVERERLEKERLVEKGEWQKVAERNQAELDVLKANQARNDHINAVSGALKMDGLSDLSDIVLRKRETPEEFAEMAKEINLLIEQRVGEKLNERLNIGKPTRSVNFAPPSGPVDFSKMTPTEWAEYKGSNKINTLRGGKPPREA